LDETRNTQSRGLEVEYEVAEDEVVEVKVDVTEMMLKRAHIRPGSRIGMVVVKKGVKKIGPSQKWNASGVASTTITQENADRQVSTIVVRSII